MANVKLSESNSRLNEAIAGLSEANRKLSCAYKEIAENSSLKEFYIGRYMEECMSYIDNLDSYRKSLLKLAGTGKLADVKDKLKSTEILDVCLKNFYADFDSTFLKEHILCDSGCLPFWESKYDLPCNIFYVNLNRTHLFLLWSGLFSLYYIF